jgi:hypothetical protein
MPYFRQTDSDCSECGIGGTGSKREGIGPNVIPQGSPEDITLLSQRSSFNLETFLVVFILYEDIGIITNRLSSECPSDSTQYRIELEPIISFQFRFAQCTRTRRAHFKPNSNP